MRASRLSVTLRTVAALGLLGMSNACGFSPIYADHGENLVQSLASVDIDRIETGNDSGFILQSALQRKLGSQGTPDYFLQVDLTEKLASEAITREANTERYSLKMTARYKLLDGQGKGVLWSSARSTVSYGVVDSPYATQVARENATRTAAESIADDIERDLVLYFKGGLVPTETGVDTDDEFFDDEL